MACRASSLSRYRLNGVVWAGGSVCSFWHSPSPDERDLPVSPLTVGIGGSPLLASRRTLSRLGRRGRAWSRKFPQSLSADFSGLRGSQALTPGLLSQVWERGVVACRASSLSRYRLNGVVWAGGSVCSFWHSPSPDERDLPVSPLTVGIGGSPLLASRRTLSRLGRRGRAWSRKFLQSLSADFSGLRGSQALTPG